MPANQQLLVLDNNFNRIVVEAAAGESTPIIQLQTQAGWKTVAYLPPASLERPAGYATAVYSIARRTASGIELYARLEDGRGGTWGITDRITGKPYGFQVDRTWQHTGGMDPQVALLFEVAYPGLQVDFWMIPGLMYNGNPIEGSGYHQRNNGIGPQPGLLYPSGWDFGGVPWVFSEEMPVPSATWLRRGDTAIGAFASPQAGPHDLLSATGFSRLEDQGEIRSMIYIPSRDLPLLYRDKNGFTPGRQTWLTVSGEWLYTRRFFILAYVESPQFSLAGFNRAAWQVLAPYRCLPAFSADEVERLRTEFMLAYHLREGEDYCGIIQGLYNDGSVRENWMSDGFVGLNVEFAYFLYAHGLRTGSAERQRIAKRMAAFFTSQQFENGLFFSNYYLDQGIWSYQFGRLLCFTRTMGERLWNLVELCTILDDEHLRQRILDFCRHSARFFIQNQLPNGSFGKIWSADGAFVEDSGSNFSFITWFLCRFYQLDPDPAYLAAAERSFEHIRSVFDCGKIDAWVDCLDSAAIDREGAAAYLQALNVLYEVTGKEIYLRYARQAAEMGLTWQYVYDVCFDVDTPLGGRMFAEMPDEPAQALPQDGVSVKPPPKVVFHSSGMTLVSVEHPCMDAWGARLGYELLRLAQFTGDEHYWERGCAAIMAAQQVIARRPGDFGQELVGAQPEQMNSRDWAYGYIALGKGAARVLISWNQVLNLATLDRVRRRFPEALEWMQAPNVSGQIHS